MKNSKLAVLLYGTLVYVLFLATYLYCAGFVLGIGVPKTIDTLAGEPSSFAVAFAVNASILGLFAVQHLIMARRWFKERWTRIIPKAAERSTFVLATCLILILMFWQWRAMPGVIWEVANPTLHAVLLGISGLGFLGVVFVTFLINHFELFGLEQVVRNFRGLPDKQPAFQVRSLYRISRHPLYLCFFLAFWCTPVMTVGHLCFAALCTGFIFVGVQFEERDLITAHGDDYINYRRDVPMILPTPGRAAAATEPAPTRA